VADYLAENFGIDPLRIVPMWYGELNPTADNGSADGRALNRRVETTVGGL
jgi:outer membrane protein OmpA-like peptidoglycan-associated protein